MYLELIVSVDNLFTSESGDCPSIITTPNFSGYSQRFSQNFVYLQQKWSDYERTRDKKSGCIYGAGAADV